MEQVWRVGEIPKEQATYLFISPTAGTKQNEALINAFTNYGLLKASREHGHQLWRAYTLGLESYQ